MPVYRKQIVLVLLLALVLICCGFYIILLNMKNMTLWPVKAPLSIETEQGAIYVSFLGKVFTLSGEEIDKLIERIRIVLARMLPLVEIKYFNMKDYLVNMLNIW